MQELNQKELSQVKDQLEEILKVKEARTNFSTFSKYVFNYKPGKIHLEWFDLSNKAMATRKQCIIFAPRGHGKSLYMAVMRPIFILGHNPNLRIKIVSHSNEKAADILRQIKDAIENNERLHKVFPNLKPGPVWAANKIIVERTIWSKDASIEAVGVLSGATGGRADWILFDDIVEFKNTLQEPAKIPMVKEAFYNNWLNLLEAENYGWCLIGTIWTQYDLHWDLYKNSNFEYKRMYRIDLNTLEPIWPEYWTKERLQQKLEEIGPRAFARAYGNRPISREDMVFNEEDISACKIRSEPKRFYKASKIKVLGVDLAISQKKKSANTALFTMGITEKEKQIPLYIDYGKWTSPETARAIIKVFDELNIDLVVVESNQYQEALKQWVHEFRRDIPIESYYTGSKKMDPEVGLPSMALEFERRKWIIPVGKLEHSSDCKCGLCTWLNEVIMYPFAEHSDILMASYFAREGYRKFFKEKQSKGEYDTIDW